MTLLTKRCRLLLLVSSVLLLASCRTLTVNEYAFTDILYEGTMNRIWVRIVSLSANRDKLADRVDRSLKSEIAQGGTYDKAFRTQAEFVESARSALLTKPAAVTLGNTIYFTRDRYAADFAQGYPREIMVNDLALLAHELMHVWQHQNRKQTGYSLLKVASEHLAYKDPYDYRLRPGKSFLSYRYEQQAEIVECYVVLRFLDRTSVAYRRHRDQIAEVLDLEDLNETLERFGVSGKAQKGKSCQDRI
ncbi:eCIS core domain-containing protein [Roseibium marinum]|uniref:Uncharacterized protein DUF4157 n=1 Tax=Roseibium marinum TaxID=281252 RepID=A0A2S3V3V0_9HYPH|nr:DUF4157 domain-containing protein [Roseibium marinum]POF34662.1 uncharacterized protein DUF4157 [Roseibium marinum]